MNLATRVVTKFVNPNPRLSSYPAYCPTHDCGGEVFDDGSGFCSFCQSVETSCDCESGMVRVALVPVSAGVAVEAERRWLCTHALGGCYEQLLKHHRTEFHPNRCQPCEDGLCPGGLTGLLPGHDACGVVWIVKEKP